MCVYWSSAQTNPTQVTLSDMGRVSYAHHCKYKDVYPIFRIDLIFKTCHTQIRHLFIFVLT